MKRIWKIYSCFITLSIARLTIFRGSFYIFMAWLLFDMLIKIFFFSAIYHQVDNIGGWTFQDSIFLVFLLSFMWDLLWVFFLFGYEEFLIKFSQGQFDFILLKPINPLLYLAMSSFNAKSFSFSRYLILIYIIFFIPFAWQLENILISLLIFFCAFIIFHAIYTIVIALSFWFVEVLPFFYHTHYIIEGSTNPISIFPPTLKFIFTFILPILLIANYPLMALKGLISWPTVILFLLLAAAFELVSYWVWHLGIKRYSSASS